MKTRTLRIIFALILALGIVFSAIPAHAAASVDPAQTEAVANASMLVDLTTGSVLYASENASLQIKPASTTKILTAAVVVDNCNLDDVVTCGPEVVEAGSKLGLVEGEEITVRDLLYGMMLVSGNDCAKVLAVHAGGSIEGFAEMMNAKAQEIGMTNSHFVNPNGLDADEHYVTCEDMAKLIIYVYNNYPFVNQLAGAKSHTFPANNKRGEAYEKFSTNKLLYKADKDAVDETYQYTTGYKTGSTPLAGGCVVATAEKNDTKLAALIYGVSEETADHNRWNVGEYLFEYGFENFVTRDISALAFGQTVSVSVNNAILPDKSKGMAEIKGTLDVPEGTIITLDKADAEGGELQIDFAPTNGMLEAPVYEGDIVGKATLRYGESVVYECDVKAAESALSTIEEMELENPVSEIEIVEVDPEQPVELTKEDMSSLWWLLLIPVAAVILLVLFMVLKNRKRSGLGYITKRERAQAPAPRSRYSSSSAPRRAADPRSKYAAANSGKYSSARRRRR